MERPVSAASSGTGTRSTTGAGHKRNASLKSGTRPAAPSMPALFVTNLRLLNIDRYPDWPSITVASFQDARGKIKCTEYALYQLFRLYDPATAADKLQPFFPPLEPLQSVNLRAALYRCLNELKKNGVLGRETVLRKTMLDECQGDKFWEVCLGFSSVVLKRATLGKKGRMGRPVAEKMGMAPSLSSAQKDSMLPLAVAHKAALGKVLEEKQRKKETYTALYDVLAEKEDELRQRKVRSEDQARKTKSLQPQKLNAVETVVTKNWIGSTELRDALVEGDTCAKGDGMLVKSFDDLWWAKGTPERTRSGGAEIGLLQSLNERAAEQNARMRRWQLYHDKLAGSKPASTQASRPVSGSQKGALRFDRHRDLNLHDELRDRSPPMPQRKSRHVSTTRYDEILSVMREELRKTSSHRNRSGTSPLPAPGTVRRSQTQPMPLRRPSLAPVDASPGATDPQARSPTAVPVRFGMGRRIASRSRSYQQPKVESQREPIQLKSELFSPLKGKRSSTASSILSSPMEEEDPPQTNGNESIAKAENDDPHDSVTASQRSSASQPGESTTSNKENDEDFDQYTEDFKKPGVALRAPQTKGPRPSLADRTRLSMAFNSADEANGLLPDGTSAASTPENHSDTITEEMNEAADALNRRTTLLERTRQSISLAPQAPAAGQPQSKKSSHARSRTSIYPVNQFETPKKGGGMVRRSTVGMDENEKRDITPMEDLLSPEAEYDSVFKSRPRIALSPVLSPFAEAGRMSEGGGTLDE